MPNSKIIVYGTNWCFDCRRARKFLDRNNIIYDWVDIDKNRQAEELVLKTNKGKRSVPTIIFPDGSFLVEPSNKQLGDKFSFST